MIGKKLLTGVSVMTMGLALVGVSYAGTMQFEPSAKAPQAQVQQSSDTVTKQDSQQIKMQPGAYMDQLTKEKETGVQKQKDAAAPDSQRQFQMNAQMDYDTMQQNHDVMNDYMNDTHGTQFNNKQVQGNAGGMMGGNSNSMGSGHSGGMGSGNMGM